MTNYSIHLSQANNFMQVIVVSNIDRLLTFKTAIKNIIFDMIIIDWELHSIFLLSTDYINFSEVERRDSNFVDD